MSGPLIIQLASLGLSIVATAGIAYLLVQNRKAYEEQQDLLIRTISGLMVTGAGGNSTVRVTDQGVILVDTKNLGDQFYNDLVAQIKTVSPQPVKYAIVTHVHQDHSGNIERFEKAGAQVIAYEGLNKNLHASARSRQNRCAGR